MKKKQIGLKKSQMIQIETGRQRKKSQRTNQSIEGSKKVETGQRYLLGNPIDSKAKWGKALSKGRYGCGKAQASKVCQACGINERVDAQRMDQDALVFLEQWRKEKRILGSTRKRRQSHRVQLQMKRGTIRGRKMRRGLPVRGQRTSTNGMTARKLNRSRERVV